MSTEQPLRDVKRAPIDGYPTSTAMIQQETETILLEHGINGGAYREYYHRAENQPTFRIDIAEKHASAIPGSKYVTRFSCTIYVPRCESALAFVLDFAVVQRPSNWT